jgi:hypothetical protein
VGKWENGGWIGSVHAIFMYGNITLDPINKARCKWLVSVATQEAENRRIIVQNQPRQKVIQTHLNKKDGHGVVCQ